MRAGVALAWLVAFTCSACLTRTPVGSLPGDAGVDAATDAGDAGAPDPLKALTSGMLGRFCGTATGANLSTTHIEIEFSKTKYVVDCGCSAPFPEQPLPDHGEGIYYVGELDLDGKGWGRAEESVVMWNYWDYDYEVVLRRISLERDTLTMTRVYDPPFTTVSMPVPVELELKRCPGGDCARVKSCEPLEANGD